MSNTRQHHQFDEYCRKIAQSRERDLELIRENLGLFIENTEYILSRPEYFNITSDAAYLGLIVGLYWQIPLGVLLMLWQEEKLVTTCPECREKAYIINAHGSSGSGVNRFTGICGKCTSIFRGSLASFPELWHVLLRMREKYPSCKPQTPLSTKRFSWKEGVVEVSIPSQETFERTASLEASISNLTHDIRVNIQQSERSSK
ncbi:hypothetical protein [Desulfonatronum parangueonense]